MDKVEAIVRVVASLHQSMWKIILPTVVVAGLVAFIWMPWWASLGAALSVEVLICAAAFLALESSSPQ